ncbi:GNAT family N-acetyltransferase [Veronia nyctiphanis]|uniref:GNAT family N-acetyltransferase n=2 Tax=Veronia nyctiphanis TaxID=1278244 RepID=A0A4V1LSS4_9GAMM|nr:GNAT family N-acetyltransferase [Veronia nyctiphanis]
MTMSWWFYRFQKVKLVRLPQAHLQKLDLSAPESLTSEVFREKLEAAGISLYEPDNVYKVPASHSLKNSQENITCRPLTQADEEIFTAFCADISEQDLDDAWVELDHWVVYGLFIDGKLAVASSLYPFRDSKLADLGVVTTPALRGKGLAKILVSYAHEQMQERDYFLQYRSQLDNLKSIGLAESMGLELVGQFEGEKTED